MGSARGLPIWQNTGMWWIANASGDAWQRMGLETIYPKPHLSQKGEPSVRYPYLLRGISIDRIDQVWSSDITYIREGSEGLCTQVGDY